MKITLKNRIILIGALNIVAAITLVLTRLTDFNSSFFNGFGIGLFAVVFPFLIFLIIKYNDKEYQQDYDLSLQDERIIRNIERSRAMGYTLQSLLIIAVTLISYISDSEMYFWVLAVVLITVIFTKFYNKSLNNKNQETSH
ncbi:MULTISPECIES: hypothetical protein [unclassified Oceanispirochaeta]|uniref:hypothetical protein n=1 Tax=unclassified Oceanispirochaeta TaxID=2635722 RepID=UPI000E094C83|nr:MULTISPECIES: hypothetical protein [unclassified Oceanispirochaeta]MBF9014003.1 hypothetical protein [Oceanispirochaeta sp. M2]NPD70494.1 hypothetical protein [Oceanispirochaeta sp. M1]RDG34263.1 hypothetical protein DV872_00150 [Oceanispirochaeta sp. M1]